MSTALEIRPQTGPQEAFLASPADIVIYGGAAGGGKTWGLLIEPLRHITNPDFRAVIFRRTSPQITNAGGLWDESSNLYPMLGAEPNLTTLSWRWPSEAVVRFAHMQHPKHMYDWQGSQIPLIGFDELTHFEAQQFWYMLSRNRSMSGVRPYVRATTNPDASSWVAPLISWWIDQETGYAIPERSGVLRWFVRTGGDLVWADDPTTLRMQYPDLPPKSLTFILSRLQDNRHLLSRNPEYLANLMALPFVERQRLYGDGELGGNWKVVPAAGKVFNRAWYEDGDHIVKHAPHGGWSCRFWDFAATEKLADNDPDYTAGVREDKIADRYYVSDMIAVQQGPAYVDRLVLATAKRDAARAKAEGRQYMVRWEEEPGSASKRDTRRLVKMLDGYDAKGIPSRREKPARARAFATQSEQGYVYLVAGEWNEAWLTHMHHQPDWPHDDIMDASAGAYNELLKGPLRQARSYQG